jgi:PKD repeat protein
VTANTPPTASFTFTCTALTCSFDASASSDPDGTVQAYAWDFGDGTSSTGMTASHTYAGSISYTVTLTVTDNSGATSTASQTFTLIALTARGYKQNGLERVDLSWNSAGGASFDVYRNGAKTATVQVGAYTDNINKRGAGKYVYKVCASAGSTCSNQATVTF